MDNPPSVSVTPMHCVWNKQEPRHKYWATRSSICLFARTTQSLRSLPRSWESEFLMSQNDLVLAHSAMMANCDHKQSWSRCMTFLGYVSNLLLLLSYYLQCTYFFSQRDAKFSYSHYQGSCYHITTAILSQYHPLIVIHSLYLTCCADKYVTNWLPQIVV